MKEGPNAVRFSEIVFVVPEWAFIYFPHLPWWLKTTALPSIEVSETGSTKTVSAIDVRIDDLLAIGNRN